MTLADTDSSITMDLRLIRSFRIGNASDHWSVHESCRKNTFFLTAHPIAIAGFITDAFVSKRRPFLLSGIIMPVSTIFFFLGRSPMAIVMSRAIQGTSVTFTWITGIAFLVNQVGEGDLGVSVGWTNAGVAIGEIFGPLVGGPIYDSLGHWAVFAVVEAFLLLDILLRVSVREKESGVEEPAIQAQQNGNVRTQSADLSERERLLPQGHADEHYHTADDDNKTKGASARKYDARNLAWNWLGTVFAMIIIFVLRGALEVVSRTRSDMV